MRQRNVSSFRVSKKIKGGIGVTEQKPILNHTDNVEAWLSHFNTAIEVSANNPGECKSSLEQLFLEKSYWKDALALTWRLETYCGASLIAENCNIP